MSKFTQQDLSQAKALLEKVAMGSQTATSPQQSQQKPERSTMAKAANKAVLKTVLKGISKDAAVRMGKRLQKRAVAPVATVPAGKLNELLKVAAADKEGRTFQHPVRVVFNSAANRDGFLNMVGSGHAIEKTSSVNEIVVHPKTLNQMLAITKKAEGNCPGGKIRSKGKGRGMGHGQGKGPVGEPGKKKNLGYIKITQTKKSSAPTLSERIVKQASAVKLKSQAHALGVLSGWESNVMPPDDVFEKAASKIGVKPEIVKQAYVEKVAILGPMMTGAALGAGIPLAWSAIKGLGRGVGRMFGMQDPKKLAGPGVPGAAQGGSGYAQTGSFSPKQMNEWQNRMMQNTMRSNQLSQMLKGMKGTFNTSGSSPWM